MSNGLPTPPTDGEKHPPLTRRPKHAAKSSSRGSKRSTLNLLPDHGNVIIDGRHKRVWKACERCRMKKTKCDGESPCKRCKDDGLVCTAGSRKKTEFKQLPRGYAEVLENTQYALIATVQKLYTMVRNGETWDLGEPEVNDRGMPVIHNIAEKLGCIRPSPDLPYAFPEDAEEFAELQTQMKLENESNGSDRKPSEDSVFSQPARTDRASSSESEPSDIERDYSQMVWAQQQQGLSQQYATQAQYRGVSMKDATSFDLHAVPSPVYSDFEAANSTATTTSPDSPFSQWSNPADDFLNPSHMLDLTALYMRQQQQQQSSPGNFPPQAHIPRSMPMPRGTINLASCSNSASATFPNMLAGDGTIRPGLLDCNPGFDLGDQMDNILFSGVGPDYENQGLMIS